MPDAAAYDIEIEDIEYLRHGDKPFLMRVVRPRGPGPFPAVVQLHGGGWCIFDRTRDKIVHKALARRGIVVAAPDFRTGEEGAYPRQMADGHYALRWLRAHARRFNADPQRIGLTGSSSGGHVAMLIAMRPHDPRYAAIPSPDGGGPVIPRCVAMLWPVVNPLGRYRYATKAVESGLKADWPPKIVGYHYRFWPDAAAMEEGNPMLILERGEKVTTPPAMWIQSTRDDVHNYHDESVKAAVPETERFAALYRKAGGIMDLENFDAPLMFATDLPDLPATAEAHERLAAFIHRHVQGN